MARKRKANAVTLKVYADIEEMETKSLPPWQIVETIMNRYRWDRAKANRYYASVLKEMQEAKIPKHRNRAYYHNRWGRIHAMAAAQNDLKTMTRATKEEQKLARVQDEVDGELKFELTRQGALNLIAVATALLGEGRMSRETYNSITIGTNTILKSNVLPEVEGEKPERGPIVVTDLSLAEIAEGMMAELTLRQDTED
jgi:hypothetical protein